MKFKNYVFISLSFIFIACSSGYNNYKISQNDVARKLLDKPSIIHKTPANTINQDDVKNNTVYNTNFDNNITHNVDLGKENTNKAQKTLFLLDSSGSMLDMDLGNNSYSKIESAKLVIKDIVNNLSMDKTSVALIKFGDNCVVTNINDFTKDKNSLINSLEKINARGSTPLAKAILNASNIVSNDNEEVNVIILSDGQETCGDNPLEAVKVFVSNNPKSLISIYILGYAVDEYTKQILEQLVIGNGKYYDVKNQNELIRALESITNELDISDNYKFSIQFDNNSIIIKPEFKDSIEEFANYVIDNDLKAVIKGHTDNIGSNKSNKILSKQRAYEVKKELIRFGVDSKNISVEGYADTQPVDTNNTKEGRYKNRRVELIAK